MTDLDNEYKKYSNFINELIRTEPADDEYAAITAYEALTAEYNLDCYTGRMASRRVLKSERAPCSLFSADQPTPSALERLKRSASAAQTGGVFSSYGGDSKCRE